MTPFHFSDPEAYLTEKDTARFLSVSRRTLQAWRVQRKGPPFVRAGRAVRYRRGSLIDWMQSTTSGSKDTKEPVKQPVADSSDVSKSTTADSE